MGNKRSEWEEFFDHHAPVYMTNEFTHNTQVEVEFLCEVLSLPKGSRILDIGCGTGRHSVALAQRGYRMTGVDLSGGMLAQASKAAEQAGVQVWWVQQDATEFVAPPIFDAAICLCEGAFGLLGSSDDPLDHDLAILRRVYAALKPGARLVMTVLNGLRMIREATQAQVDEGVFDPLALVTASVMEVETPDGMRRFRLREKGFTPPELRLLMRQAGLEVEHLWGGTAGNWRRGKPDLDEMEIMAVGRKAG
jgi:cyclopropane fatty-acyl-phospholipid synthase-like methyltransferase